MLRLADSQTHYAQITSLGNIRFGAVRLRGRLVNPGNAVARMRVDLDFRKKGSYLRQDAYRHGGGVIHSQSEPLSLQAGKAAPKREGFPRYHYWIHSWNFVPSVMGFATAWLTGEFTGYPLEGTSTLKPDGTLGKNMGLGLLRSRCLSTNWGVPNMFLPLVWEHTQDHPTDKQTLMELAWLLPHGIPIGDPKYLNQNTMREIVRVMLRFRARHATFTPAWRPNPYFEIESPIAREVMVATWDHRPADKVLAVVSNLTVDETHIVALRWKGAAGVQITNARTADVIPLERERLSLALGPESFVLLEAAGTQSVAAGLACGCPCEARGRRSTTATAPSPRDPSPESGCCPR